MTDHPLERMMDYPVDGCECANCSYARWFDVLTPEQQREEIDAMLAYDAEVER